MACGCAGVCMYVCMYVTEVRMVGGGRGVDVEFFVVDAWVTYLGRVKCPY